MSIGEIIERSTRDNHSLSDDDIRELLSVDVCSNDFYLILSASNDYSRKKFSNKGYVFVQIGLNSEPCSGNCLFCSMGAEHFSVNAQWRKGPDEVVTEISQIDQSDVDDIFLMTTADYPFEEYLQVVSKVRPLLDKGVRLVANIRDFNLEEAYMLKAAGITGAYHVNRLREGIDTSLSVEQRLVTLDAIKKSGLELYNCIEPIGAEHSYDEILAEIVRARDLEPEVMAVMRRVNYPDSPLSGRNTVSVIELVKIAAVTNIVVHPSRAMNLHEPEQMSLLAGVNQVYAEIGANPRDTCNRTEMGRGLGIKQAGMMLSEAGYMCRLRYPH